ncbi:MAG: CPBP family intramembrane metalloprotease [Clostridia bacterium]|nr:CPBP family intramembrane metalloprotease [Clostridia bacterium]
MNIKNSHAAPFLMIAELALLILLRLTDLSFTSGGENPYLSVIVLQLVIFIIPCMLFYRIRRTPAYTKRMRLRPFAPRQIGFVVVALVAVTFGSTALSAIIGLAFPGAGQVENSYIGPAPDSLISLQSIVAYALVPAVSEEFLCRSVLFSEYEEIGTLQAVVMTSVMFAMLHLNLYLFPVYFFCGVILAFVLYVTNSVLAVILVHFMNNIFFLYYEVYLTEAIQSSAYSSMIMFLLISIFLLSMILLFAYAEKIFIRYGKQGKVPEPKEKVTEKWRKCLLSAPLLALVLFYVIASAASV